MLQSGVQLLDRFAQAHRVRIRQPRRNLHIKFTQISGRRAERLLGLYGCLYTDSQGFERQTVDFPREALHRSVAPPAEPLCAFQP
jgi:hypothetical protein